MGFFSWKTADTQESIANVYVEHPNTGRTVYLLQPNGEEAIAESGYQGYGVFNGVDAYAWLAKNNLDCFSEEVREEISDLDLYECADQLRDYGIKIAFDNKVVIQHPLKFSFNKDAVYERLDASDNCEYQGFFYPYEA